MRNTPITIIQRHRKENLKKCSLRGLESRNDLCFYTYPHHPLPEDLTQYTLLSLEAPELGPQDAERGLLLIDGTWRLAGVMTKQMPTKRPPVFRSLPKRLKTAYPRRQNDCDDPERGLASVEALFAAYFLMGKDTSGLLDYYIWKQNFLEKNQDLFNLS